MTTWNSRGLRGAGLEELINRTNEKYLEKGLALIQKIPTPVSYTHLGKLCKYALQKDQTGRYIWGQYAGDCRRSAGNDGP